MLRGEAIEALLSRSGCSTRRGGRPPSNLARRGEWEKKARVLHVVREAEDKPLTRGE